MKGEGKGEMGGEKELKEKYELLKNKYKRIEDIKGEHEKRI